MILPEGDFLFDFSRAIKAFKFDEEDQTLPTVHGLSHCMKAVDFVAEYEEYYLFVEVKAPKDPSRYGTEKSKAELINSLVTKFRDTFLYRWAESKIDKPIRYLCLVELDNAQTLYLTKQLSLSLPTAKQPARWQQPLAQMCAVANRKIWNKSFPTMQVTLAKEGRE